MRKNPVFSVRNCTMCGNSYTPSGVLQKYCHLCIEIANAERKREHYIKTHPNAYKIREQKQCCVCGELNCVEIDGNLYCNKHYLRVKNHGSTELQQQIGKNIFEIKDGIATIFTSKGEPFTIDELDFDKIHRYTWCFSKTGYLVANINYKVVKLHRYLLDALPNLTVDHIDGNPANNQRSNLRLCSQNDNCKNSRNKIMPAAGHQGIRITPKGKYKVRITVDRKEINLGTFVTLDEAVIARKNGEIMYYGEFSPSISRMDT